MIVLVAEAEVLLERALEDRAVKQAKNGKIMFLLLPLLTITSTHIQVHAFERTYVSARV